MRCLDQITFRLKSLFQKEKLDEQLSDEIREHVELATDSNIAKGMPPQEARYAAMREFGGMEQIKERARDERNFVWVEQFRQDLRYGMKSLSRTPAFTIAALAMIGIGVGANTAMFSYVDAVFLKPNPFPDSERIVQVDEKAPNGSRTWSTALTYLDWAKQNTVFEHTAASLWNYATLTGAGEPVRVPQQLTSAQYFEIFRVKPELGRTFIQGEDKLGHDRVVVLTNLFWVTQFGSDPTVIGRKIILDGEPTEVIGVLPKGVSDRGAPQIFRPLAFGSQDLSRDWHRLIVSAKLKLGVTLQQAQAEMDIIGERIASDHPETNKGWGVAVTPITETLVSDDLKQSLYVLMAVAGMILLIGCANLTNLTLVRSMVRRREITIRAALGAARWRLVRQFLTESLLLFLLGNVFALLVAYWGIATLRRAMPMPPLSAEAIIDGRVLLFTLGLSLVTAIFTGLAPALWATRSDLTRSLKETGPGSGIGHGLSRYRNALVVIEVALAFAMLSGAGFLMRSFSEMQKVKTGYDSTNVLTASLPIAVMHFTSVTEFGVYLRQIVDRIGSLPGVRDAALTNALPMESVGYGMYFRISGEEIVDPANRPTVIFKQVTPSYFSTLGLKLVKGRMLSDGDVSGTLRVTVISTAMAHKYFPNEDPVGKHILVPEFQFGSTRFGAEVPWKVVGIVTDERLGGVRDNMENRPAIYVPTDQSLQSQHHRLVVRGTVDPTTLLPAIRNAIHEINPDQVLDRIITLDQIKADSMWSDQIRLSITVIFSGVALLIAGVGLYGVLSYSVEQRTPEIGIRTALGATSKSIVGLILRDGAKLTVTGILIGQCGALGLSQVFASLLFNVGGYDPVTLVIVAVILSATALFACWLPARRAVKVDPMVALRAE